MPALCQPGFQGTSSGPILREPWFPQSVSPPVLKEASRAHGFDRIPPFGRLFLAVPMAVFGAQHFTAAIYVARLLPSWIPGHLFWTYFVGVALLVGRPQHVTGKKARLADGRLAILLHGGASGLHPAIAAFEGSAGMERVAKFPDGTGHLFCRSAAKA
jgi:hypothetical protein